VHHSVLLAPVVFPLILLVLHFFSLFETLCCFRATRLDQLQPVKLWCSRSIHHSADFLQCRLEAASWSLASSMVGPAASEQPLLSWPLACVPPSGELTILERRCGQRSLSANDDNDFLTIKDVVYYYYYSNYVNESRVIGCFDDRQSLADDAPDQFDAEVSVLVANVVINIVNQVTVLPFIWRQRKYFVRIKLLTYLALWDIRLLDNCNTFLSLFETVVLIFLTRMYCVVVVLYSPLPFLCYFYRFSCTYFTSFRCLVWGAIT